jgi:acetolactate synthase II small subunit
MPNRLQLWLDNQSGALERLLRVTRHRGYRVHHFAARWTEGDRIEVSMEVESNRPLINLVTQLSKLEEVRSLATRHAPVRVAA